MDDKNTLRQELVNQCGVRQAFCNQGIPQNPPDNPVQLFYNVTKQCSVLCPDGNPFVFTVLAGTFASSTQAAADNQASAYACEQAGLRKLCLGPISKCLCVGSAFSATISHTGGIPPFTWSVFSGSLPDGLTLNGSGVISGTPTVSGSFAFTIQITAIDGSYMRKPYSISVLEITTTTITGYNIGTPYTFQMAAAGGSGNYQWSIASGALPDGLTMTDAGLISGTPTAGGTNPVVFRLIDLTCEAAQQSAFPPRVVLSARSTTQIATVLGFDQYTADLPPKRYHTLTWDGHSEQQLWFPAGTLGNPGVAYQVAGARFDYSGATTVNGAGTALTRYSKNLSKMCDATGSLYTCLVPGVNGGLQQYIFAGWLGPTNHTKCDPPGVPYQPLGDQAIGTGQAARNDSSLFWGSHKPNPASSNVQTSNFVVIDGTHAACNDVNSDINFFGIISLFEPLPLGNVPLIDASNQGIIWFLGAILWDHVYSATLSNEYTDAEALANARVVVGNGTTAQNLPRTTGFVSTFTGVAFSLTCNTLVVGQDYLVSVDLWDSVAVVPVTRQYGFTANAVTHAINDTIPTPASGHSITVRNPRIVFSPP